MEVSIRPLRPEDERRVAAFHGRLAERSIYQRYFHLLSLDQRVAHDRLLRVCFGDYNREIALDDADQGGYGLNEHVQLYAVIR